MWTSLLGAALALATPPVDGLDVAPGPSRLVILIVADQMGSGLLDLHGPHLDGGIGRMLREGRRFNRTTVDHAPTNSMPGHVSAATGAHPRRHGLIDNRWAENGENVLGFDDQRCAAVTEDGRDEDGRRIGPGRIESASIAEWLQAANPKSRNIALSTGGGVAALHAVNAQGPALWFSPTHGGWISSSCFVPELPQWAIDANAILAAEFRNRDWGLQAPVAMLASLRPDATSFENRGIDFEFPHLRPANDDAWANWFVDTPLADEALLRAARMAVEAEALGQDGVPDILTIGLSSLDHVGHAFGPYSVEQADTLYRLDHALGNFFEFLDRHVGTERWTVALTADHGAPVAPEDAARFGIDHAKRISQHEAIAATQSILQAADGEGTDAERLQRAIAAARALPFVYRVITEEDIRAATWDDDVMAGLYANSYRPGRTSLHPLYSSADGLTVASLGLIIVPHPNFVVDWATSIHGSPFPYDRKVEMMFMGPGIVPGHSNVPARTIDVAPTLAATIGVKPTGPIDGRMLPLRTKDETNR